MPIVVVAPVLVGRVVGKVLVVLAAILALALPLERLPPNLPPWPLLYLLLPLLLPPPLPLESQGHSSDPWFGEPQRPQPPLRLVERPRPLPPFGAYLPLPLPLERLPLSFLPP